MRCVIVKNRLHRITELTRGSCSIALGGGSRGGSYAHVRRGEE